MEPTLLALTPEQQGFLAALARERGTSVSSLLAKALAGLEENSHPHHGNGETNGGDEHTAPAPPQETRPPIWERCEEASRTIPDAELDRLPTDLAAQIEHYVYGTPKR